MRRILLYGLVLCSFLMPFKGIGTSLKPDSLFRVLKAAKEDTNKVKTLNALFETETIKGNYTISDSVGKLSLQLSEKLNYKKGIVNANLNLGILYTEEGNYPTALKYEQQALAAATEMKYQSGIFNAYTNIGNIYQNQGNFPQSLDTYLKSLKIAEELDSKTGMAKAYVNIGNVYESTGNYPEALKNQQQALKIDSVKGNKVGMGIVNTNIGNIYWEMKSYPEALQYELKALSIKQSLGNKPGISIALSCIGAICNDMGKYDEALSYYKQALEITREIGNKYDQCYCYSGLASTNIKLKNYNLARHYLDSSKSLALNEDNKEILKVIYKKSTILDSAANDYGKAFSDYKQYITYRDSLNNKENTKKLVAEQMQYDFDKKQTMEKAAQDKKDAVADQESKKQLIIRNSFVAGFILVLALAFFIFRGYRQKKKDNEIITLQKAEVIKQKEIVEEKQKEILDSIHYAQRIQKALLASDDMLKQNLPEYFVLYKPKDIVSGDFYWGTHKDDRFYLAVCDSTGHGVPGAFMSLLNISFLNEGINEKNIVDPNEVFNHARKRLINNISQDGQQDGMDGALICIPVGSSIGQMAYSVAYNAPIVIRNGELIELNADKLPVGKSPKDHEPFKNFTFNLQKGDVVYAFTDGFADQFGGEKGKKFKYKQLLGLLLANYKSAMAEQKLIFEKAFEEWRGDFEQIDDVLIVGIRV